MNNKKCKRITGKTPYKIKNIIWYGLCEGVMNGSSSINLLDNSPYIIVCTTVMQEDDQNKQNTTKATKETRKNVDELIAWHQQQQHQP